MRSALILILCLFLNLPALAQPAVPELDQGLQELASEFFEWRRIQQPASGDDIPRVERPQAWVPKFSPEDLALQRVRYRDFLKRLESLSQESFSRADKVDALALEAAIKRVGWEIDVLRAPHRNPLFYVDQTLGSIFELLVLSSPIDDQRLNEIALRLRHFSSSLASAEKNLNEAVQPFAVATIDSLMDIEDRLSSVKAGLTPFIGEDQLEEMELAFSSAARAHRYDPIHPWTRH